MSWKSNCICIPSGQYGKRFVSELARLFRVDGEGSALGGIAIKAALTLCSPVLLETIPQFKGEAPCQSV